MRFTRPIEGIAQPLAGMSSARKPRPRNAMNWRPRPAFAEASAGDPGLEPATCLSDSLRRRDRAGSVPVAHLFGFGENDRVRMSSEEQPITPSTKIAALLEHYPELEDLLISIAPPFKRLRNPILRKTVAKVASLRQAAAVARLPVEELVNKLRAAVGQAPVAAEEVEDPASYFSSQPAWFDPGRIVATIDERGGGDPDEMTLKRVARDVKSLREAEILELITTFLPAPGIDVMRARGFLTWSLEEGPELFRTYFRKPGA